MTSRTYPTNISALHLVDVLNNFRSEDGKLAGQIGPMLEKTDLQANLQRLLTGARKAGMQIFYAPHS